MCMLFGVFYKVSRGMFVARLCGWETFSLFDLKYSFTHQGKRLDCLREHFLGYELEWGYGKEVICEG